jgi:hypothetical protein
MLAESLLVSQALHPLPLMRPRPAPGPRGLLPLLLTLAVGGLACAPRVAAATPSARPLRVLFIGNSYIHNNNLPALVEGLARSATPPRQLETRAVTRAGVRLRQHWEKGDALAALQEGPWDYVVLQEQSTLGLLLIEGRHEVHDPEPSFYPYARRFVAEARKVGAQPLLMLTWARRESPESQPRLTHAYMTLARELEVPVIPAGLAWERVRQEHPEVELFHPDGSHPSPAGSYLVAATLYATITRQSPLGLTATISGHPRRELGVDTSRTVTLAALRPEQAELLQRTAWASYEALRKAGGYLKVQPPAPALPTLPQSEPLQILELLGEWQGELRFYSQEAGQTPATLHLSLRQVGNHLEGSARVVFQDGQEEGPFALEAPVMEPSRLRFLTPLQNKSSGKVEHEAVLTAEGLRGMARYENTRNKDRYVGTWRLQRQELAASAPAAEATSLAP